MPRQHPARLESEWSSRRATTFSTTTVLGCALALAGCGGSEDTPDSERWVGDVVTEGNVTRVANLSGSVWGEGAALVERASIGVAEGAEPYMLGGVRGIAAHNERIYVVDSQVPVVRVYDWQGEHVADIGGAGQGPGEFEGPNAIAISPEGRVHVRDPRNGRIVIFDEAGEPLGIYPTRSGFFSSDPLVLTRDGVLYTRDFQEPEEGTDDFLSGMRAVSDDGFYGDLMMPSDFDFEPRILEARSEAGMMAADVKFAPRVVWAMSPSGAMIAGLSSSYRFQIDNPDGSSVRVERRVDPVAVEADESDWWRRAQTAEFRDMVSDWTWTGDDIPSTKPAFSAFVPAMSGAIWVRRPGPGRRLQNCDLEAETADEFFGRPCWDELTLVDVFGDDGRFLSTLAMPEGLSEYPIPYIDGNVVIAVVEDELGTVLVKRYELVRPDET